MRLDKAFGIATVCIAFSTLAVDKPAAKPLQPQDPMSGKMMKPGMKKGDMKKDAREKQRVIKPMLEKEEKSMERKPK
jgi:hypothetical protein